MATTEKKATEELMQAYNQAVSSGFAAMDAGLQQATSAAKTMTDAAEAERAEYGKVVQVAAAHSRTQAENLATLVPDILRDMTTPPSFDGNSKGSSAKESIGKFIESETSFYKSWTQAWMDYLVGAEERRSAFAKSMLEGNVKAAASAQEAAIHAARFSEALFDWSTQSPTAAKS